MSVRIKEHLSDSASNKNAVKERIQNCNSCSQEQDLNYWPSASSKMQYIYGNSEMQYSL